MKTSRLIFFARLYPVLPMGLVLLAMLVGVSGGAQDRRGESPPGKKAGDQARGPRLGGDVWSSLSEEERRKLREVLRRVWSDPEVQNAREEVKNAAENYKKAVKAAVGKEDSKVAALLVKVQSENAGKARRLLPPGPPRPGDGKGERRSLAHLHIGGPDFLEKLSKEQRKQFLKAQAIAKDRPEVKDAWTELEKIRKKDDAIRKERLQAFTKLRRVSLQALLSVDPDLKDILPGGALHREQGKRSGKKKPAP